VPTGARHKGTRRTTEPTEKGGEEEQKENGQGIFGNKETKGEVGKNGHKKRGHAVGATRVVFYGPVWRLQGDEGNKNDQTGPRSLARPESAETTECKKSQTDELLIHENVFEVGLFCLL